MALGPEPKMVKLGERERESQEKGMQVFLVSVQCSGGILAVSEEEAE